MKGPLSWLDKWLTDWENRWFCCALLTFFFCLFFFVFPEISAYICFTSLDLYSFRHFPWSRHCLLCLEVMDHFYLFSLSSQELNHRNLYTISDQQSLISTQQIFFKFFAQMLCSLSKSSHAVCEGNLGPSWVMFVLQFFLSYAKISSYPSVQQSVCKFKRRCA